MVSGPADEFAMIAFCWQSRSMSLALISPADDLFCVSPTATNPSLRLKPFLNAQNATAESNGESRPKRIRQIETP
jgi:hypothetical protein